jgi:hypothetical protein
VAHKHSVGKPRCKRDNSVISKVMPCWAWVAPLVWCFIPSWLLSANSWNFIKKGYEILRLRIKCRRLENIYSYSTHTPVISWRRSRKKGQGELSLAPNLVVNSVSCPFKPSVLFPLFFEISSPMWPHRGFQCCLFLTLRITLMFYEYDQWIHLRVLK